MPMSRSSATLAIWNRLASWPGGRWLFSRLVCIKAPYFGSISPRFQELRPQYCRVTMRKRRGVLNHIGTVHAIAMCNLAEIAAGTMTDVTVPSTHRWIPKGMTVSYLKTARSSLTAIAAPESAMDLSGPSEYRVKVEVQDEKSEVVFVATINMWISPRKDHDR